MTADASLVRRLSRSGRKNQAGKPAARTRPGSRPQEKGGAPIAVDDARVNEQIRSRDVRLIGAEGEQMGVLSLPDALEYAKGKDLDLVEVAPNANPPVCRAMDFSRYKYEQNQRKKEARKKQRQGAGQISVKEMKFRPKIDAHDYATKVRHVERFLREGSKVKLTIMFRGREVSHPELGKRILDRVAVEVGEVAEIEHYPRIDGRNMTMVLAPLKDGRRKKPPSAEEQAGGRTPATEPVTEAPAAEADASATPTPAATTDQPPSEPTTEQPPAEQPPAELAQEPAS